MKNLEITQEELKKQLQADNVCLLPTANDDKIIDQAKAIQQRKANEFGQRMQRFISGQEKPPNNMVAYSLRKLEELEKDIEWRQKAITELTNRINMLKDEMISLQGCHRGRIQDIEHWLKNEED